MKTQQNDKEEWVGRWEADMTQHQRSRGKKAFQKKKKSVLNVSSKIRTEKCPLDLTALRSSMSNFSEVSREQSP